MTRINLVPVGELMDQHLFAEFREIKMVPKALQRSINAKGLAQVLSEVPAEFTLNKGHVKFFYDKGSYLKKRFHQIRAELKRRGINYNEESRFDPNLVYLGITSAFVKDYEPTPEALAIIRERISLRISERPGWYRHQGRIV